MISGSAKKVMLIGVAFFLVIMMFAAVGIGGGSTEDDIDLSTSLLSEAVERYRPYVTKRAEVYDMGAYAQAYSKDNLNGKKHLMRLEKVGRMKKRSVLFINDSKWINTARVIDVKGHLKRDSQVFQEIMTRVKDMIS